MVNLWRLPWRPFLGPLSSAPTRRASAQDASLPFCTKASKSSLPPDISWAADRWTPHPPGSARHMPAGSRAGMGELDSSFHATSSFVPLLGWAATGPGVENQNQTPLSLFPPPATPEWLVPSVSQTHALAHLPLWCLSFHHKGSLTGLTPTSWSSSSFWLPN